MTDATHGPRNPVRFMLLCSCKVHRGDRNLSDKRGKALKTGNEVKSKDFEEKGEEGVPKGRE